MSKLTATQRKTLEQIRAHPMKYMNRARQQGFNLGSAVALMKRGLVYLTVPQQVGDDERPPPRYFYADPVKSARALEHQGPLDAWRAAVEEA